MFKGSTPTHTFELPFDVGLISNFKITYAQGGSIVLTKTPEDCTLEGNTISTKLTQEETLLFSCNLPVQIQVRVLTNNENALVSDILQVPVKKCLDNEVLV